MADIPYTHKEKTAAGYDRLLPKTVEEQILCEGMTKTLKQVREEFSTHLDKNAQDLAAHLAAAITHAETANRTITVGVDKDFTSISAAVDSLKKGINSNSTVTIKVDPGNYNEDVTIAGFMGGGAIKFVGGTSITDCINYTAERFFVNYCVCNIEINGFNATTTQAYRGGFHNESSLGLRVINCACTTNSRDIVSSYGLYTARGNTLVQNCLFSNRYYGIGASGGGTIDSRANNGVDNLYGLSAQYGGEISKNGTQPGGTTAEYKYAGGQIL